MCLHDVGIGGVVLLAVGAPGLKGVDGKAGPAGKDGAAGKEGPPGCRLYLSAATALAVGVHTVVVLAVHVGMEGECGDSSRVWRGGVGGRCGEARTRAGCVRVCTRAGCFVRCSTCRTSRVVPASLSRCRTVSACGTAHAASQYASVAHGHCGCTAVGRMQQRACSAL